jgi:hypothetical protein
MRLSDLQRRIYREIESELILDQFPNASAAFSLQALSSSSGAVVRVQRSSDNAEQDFTENGILSGLLTQFVGAGNIGSIRILYDQSGNGNHAIQTNRNNQPLIVSNGALIFSNGKPSVLFDTYTKRLDFSSVTPVSVFTVAKIDTIGIINYILFSGIPPARGFWYAQQGNGPGAFFESLRSTPSQFRSTNQQLVSYFNNPQNFQVNINSSNSFNLQALNQFSVNQIGRSDQSNLNFNGKISEIIMYDFNQSANRLAIEANINQRYAIF